MLCESRSISRERRYGKPSFALKRQTLFEVFFLF
jgi:hypothetical protein